MLERSSRIFFKLIGFQTQKAKRQKLAYQTCEELTRIASLEERIESTQGVGPVRVSNAKWSDALSDIAAARA